MAYENLNEYYLTKEEVENTLVYAATRFFCATCVMFFDFGFAAI